MAVISEGTATQTAVIGTEHVLVALTGAKTYMLLVDATPMLGGVTPDIVVLRVKAKVLTAGAEVLAYEQSFVGLQGSKLKVSIPIPSLFSVSFTLTQTQGTGRAYPWLVVSV